MTENVGQAAYRIEVYGPEDTVVLVVEKPGEDTFRYPLPPEDAVQLGSDLVESVQKLRGMQQ